MDGDHALLVSVCRKGCRSTLAEAVGVTPVSFLTTGAVLLQLYDHYLYSRICLHLSPLPLLHGRSTTGKEAWSLHYWKGSTRCLMIVVRALDSGIATGTTQPRTCRGRTGEQGPMR